MSKAVKTVFGGTDDSAQKAQTRANAAAQEFIATQTKAARSDILNLYPAADANRQRGFEASRQALLAGVPQFQNAILGKPVDMGALDIPIPQFISTTDALSQGAPPQIQGAPQAQGAQQAQGLANMQFLKQLSGSRYRG